MEEDTTSCSGDGGSSSSSPLMENGMAVRNENRYDAIQSSSSALNEAASFLAESTTSLFTRCFTNFSTSRPAFEEPDDDDDGQELLTFSSGSHRNFFSTPSVSTVTPQSIHSRLFDAPLVHDPLTTTSSQEYNNNPTGLVLSNNMNTNGTSLFQGLVDKVRKTFRGSADDIGWLQRAPDMPPVEDGTGRFTEILGDIRHGLHGLPDSMVYLFVPGLFSNHGPLYFVNTKASFSKMGLTCHIAKIHSEASVHKNAKEIKEYIEEMYWGSNKRVMVLGHSKGGVDAAASMSIYWDELKDKVAGLALAQSPYGGSPIASDILREGQIGDYVNVRKLMEVLICKVLKGDMQALEDLTYEKRKQFLRKYRLPTELPVVSFHTEASISPAVLATLSRVAHAELPGFSTGQSAKLPVVIPLGAAMAACAQLLQTRYGEKSDGLVTCRDAEVPGSVVVRPKRKLDHAWMVYSSLSDDATEADASQVCEALLTLLVEVGMRKRDGIGKKD